jgi:hypothetical protein
MGVAANGVILPARTLAGNSVRVLGAISSAARPVGGESVPDAISQASHLGGLVLQTSKRSANTMLNPTPLGTTPQPTERRSGRLKAKRQAEAAQYPSAPTGARLHRSTSFGEDYMNFSKSGAINALKTEMLDQVNKVKSPSGTAPDEIVKFVTQCYSEYKLNRTTCLWNKQDEEGRAALSVQIVDPKGDPEEKIKPKPALPVNITTYNSNIYDLGHGATHSMAFTDVKPLTDNSKNITLEAWHVNQGYTRGVEYAALDLAKKDSSTAVFYVKQVVYGKNEWPKMYNYFFFMAPKGTKVVEYKATASVKNKSIGHRPAKL